MSHIMKILVSTLHENVGFDFAQPSDSTSLNQRFPLNQITQIEG